MASISGCCVCLEVLNTVSASQYMGYQLVDSTHSLCTHYNYVVNIFLSHYLNGIIVTRFRQ